MPDKKLTDNEKLVFDAIVEYIADNGYPPTVRELCKLTGINSTGNIHAMLTTLEEKGCIEIARHHSRGIKVKAKTASDVMDFVNDRILSKADYLQKMFEEQPLYSGSAVAIMKDNIEKAHNWLEEVKAKAKAEAYKEFAERLHCVCQNIINEPWNKTVSPDSWTTAYEKFDEQIDNLLKEMMEAGEV